MCLAGGTGLAPILAIPEHLLRTSAPTSRCTCCGGAATFSSSVPTATPAPTPTPVPTSAIADAVTASVRINSAGGPFGLPLLALHADEAEQILPAVLDRLAGLVAAPLPTEPLRRRAVQRIENLIEQVATVALGGPSVPDDITHRMSWRLPPTVLLLGDPDSPAARREQATVPLGPVLSVVKWTNGDQLEALFTGAKGARRRSQPLGT